MCTGDLGVELGAFIDNGEVAAEAEELDEYVLVLLVNTLS